jgi:hypothetical protein
MIKREISVGDTIESNCTKCKALLNHTIVAMVAGKVVRVKCNTCGSEHNHRAAKSEATTVKRAAAKSPAAARKTPKEKSDTSDLAEWEEFFSGVERGKAIPYDMAGKFRVKTLVDHPVFGIGIVKSTQNNKMDVLFQGGRKLLRCVS